MKQVLISGDSRFPVNKARIRRIALATLKEYGVKGDMSVSIRIVGDRKMRQLNREYRDLDKTGNVLSFPTESVEGVPHEFEYPKDEAFPLGDVVISYPQARDQAAKTNVFVDDELERLVIHGVKSLLGMHE